MVQAAGAINVQQSTGIAGQIDLNVPKVIQPYFLDSSVLAVPNEIGFAYTFLASSDDTVTAGGTGVYAGILVDPKVYASFGDGTDTFAPVTALQNAETGQFLLSGSCLVNIAEAADNGDQLFYDETTGELFATVAGGRTAILNSRIQCTIAAPGLTRVLITAGV